MISGESPDASSSRPSKKHRSDTETSTTPTRWHEPAAGDVTKIILGFTGENLIDHTPRGETIRLSAGNTFDLVGERIRSDFKGDSRGHWVEGAFTVKLRNRKDTSVEIRVVEHLYRWNNWNIIQTSAEYTKLDSRTIEFRIPVEPDGESILSYRVHYSW